MQACIPFFCVNTTASESGDLMWRKWQLNSYHNNQNNSSVLCERLLKCSKLDRRQKGFFLQIQAGVGQIEDLYKMQGRNTLMSKSGLKFHCRSLTRWLVWQFERLRSERGHRETVHLVSLCLGSEVTLTPLLVTSHWLPPLLSFFWPPFPGLP